MYSFTILAYGRNGKDVFGKGGKISDGIMPTMKGFMFYFFKWEIVVSNLLI